MADVAGVLLDEVDDDVAALDPLIADVENRVEVDVDVDRPGVLDLGSPRRPG